MTFGIIGALIAALTYGAATILQALGVAALAKVPKDSPLTAKARPAALYGAGLALDGIGFLASAGALRTLPLFLVQSVVAASVAVTAVLAVVVLKARLSRREIIALGVVALGLVLLAGTAHEGPPHGVPHWLPMATLASIVVVAALGLAGYRAHSGSTLAVAAGLGFSGVGVAARILPWDGHVLHTLTSTALWALLLHGVAATVAYGFALDAGETTSVSAITFAVETVVPALVGLALLGDQVRHHTAPIAVIGFVLTLGACVALAGRSEASA